MFTPCRTTPRATSPLAASQLDAHIVDLVAEQTLTHRFENTTAEPLEIVYSFPLPLDAAFLGFSATIAGRTLHARVQAKATATRRYDDAIAGGHSAVLLTTPEPGVVCASLGNLLPGEHGEITLRFATALRVADGTARYSLPLVHRPRYGHWRLEDLETPRANFAVEHPLTARITVSGLLAHTDTRCSSHAATLYRDAGSQRIELPHALLDRDLVLTFPLDKPLAPTAQLIRDGDANLAVVNVVLPERAEPSPALEVCLLLDGSGSMTGDAIAQSRRALAVVADALGMDDRLQVIRFGSEVVPLFRRPLKVTTDVRGAVHELTAVIEADLGGTEMGAALHAGMAQFRDAPRDHSRAVILVTDGAVQPEDIATACRDAQTLGIRVFVVAVGSAAGTEVLTPLAVATGGMLERALPGEPIDICVARQLARAREAEPLAVDVHWPGSHTPTLPADPAYPGDAITLAARLPVGCTGSVSVVLPGMKGATMPLDLSAATDAPAQRALTGLRRYAAAPASEREALALHYSLLTAETAAVLVRERATAEQPAALPHIVAIEPMMPAGTVGDEWPDDGLAYSLRQPTARFCILPGRTSDYLDPPAFLRVASDPKKEPAQPKRRRAPRQPARHVLGMLHHALLMQFVQGNLDLDGAITQAATRIQPVELRAWVDGLALADSGSDHLALLLLLALHAALDQPAWTDDEEARIALCLHGTPADRADVVATRIRAKLRG